MNKAAKTITAAMLSAAIAVTAGAGFAGAAKHASNFGCTKSDRDIGATAYYYDSGSHGAGHFYVNNVNYEYTNSGGGESNTRFRLYNRFNAVAWSWSTPDDRKNKRYSKKVKRTIAGGDRARIYQKTWFDTFGNDPSCSFAGYIA